MSLHTRVCTPRRLSSKFINKSPLKENCINQLNSPRKQKLLKDIVSCSQSSDDDINISSDDSSEEERISQILYPSSSKKIKRKHLENINASKDLKPQKRLRHSISAIEFVKHSNDRSNKILDDRFNIFSTIKTSSVSPPRNNINTSLTLKCKVFEESFSKKDNEDEADLSNISEIDSNDSDDSIAQLERQIEYDSVSDNEVHSESDIENIFSTQESRISSITSADNTQLTVGIVRSSSSTEIQTVLTPSNETIIPSTNNKNVKFKPLKFKKGGLAEKFQCALAKTKSEGMSWKHELQIGLVGNSTTIYCDKFEETYGRLIVHFRLSNRNCCIFLDPNKKNIEKLKKNRQLEIEFDKNYYTIDREVVYLGNHKVQFLD